MVPDSNVASDMTSMAEAAGENAAETARANATDAATNLGSTASAMADTAEAANTEGLKAAHHATQVFGEARERLNAMSGLMPEAAQQMFRPFQMGGESFGKGFEASYANVVQGMAEFNSKAIAAWRSNAESTIQHWQSLTEVKSFSEAIARSAEHTRQQMEAVTAQTRELSALATKIVRDAADPLKMTGR